MKKKPTPEDFGYVPVNGLNMDSDWTDQEKIEFLQHELWVEQEQQPKHGKQHSCHEQYQHTHMMCLIHYII